MESIKVDVLLRTNSPHDAQSKYLFRKSEYAGLVQIVSDLREKMELQQSCMKKSRTRTPESIRMGFATWHAKQYVQCRYRSTYSTLKVLEYIQYLPMTCTLYIL
jgi:hypothetical protein